MPGRPNRPNRWLLIVGLILVWLGLVLWVMQSAGCTTANPC